MDDKKYQLLINNRESVDLNGVIKLDSFNQNEFLVETELGYLNIKGANLSLGLMDMDKGTLTIQGRIDSLSYIKKEKEADKESFFKKLFK